MHIECDGCEGRKLLQILLNVNRENLTCSECDLLENMLDDLTEYLEFIESHFFL